MKFLLIYITILLTTAVGIAQDIQVTTTVNKNKVGLQENFEYKIEISGKSMSLPDPVFPELDEFYIISGPNSSTNIQYINGKMSSSKTYSYYLQPQKLGKINLPQVKLEYNGKIYTSNSIQIEVIKGAKAKSQNQKQQQTTSRKDEDLLGESLYLKAELNKRTAFVNEPITVTYKLYFRVSVRSFNWEKIPSNPGFWMEEFEIPSQPPIENEIINGMTYQVATLRKIALFPTKSGELLIEPLSVSVDALVKSQRKSRSLFDSFFDDPFGRTVRKVLSSKAIPINIKPLPEKNKPINFSGAVGNFSLSVTSDKAQLKVNEAASVKISVSGEGNIKLVKAPALKTPPDMEVYDPKEKTNINRDNNRISGNKIVEYIIGKENKNSTFFNLKILDVTFCLNESGRKISNWAIVVAARIVRKKKVARWKR